MNTHPTTSSDETTRVPETVGDGEDRDDPRRLARETDDRDPEEAGYGYGV